MKLASFWKLSNLWKYRNISYYIILSWYHYDFSCRKFSSFLENSIIYSFKREEEECLWKVCTSLYSASNVQAVRCHSRVQPPLIYPPSSPQENFVLGCPSMKQWYHLSIIHPLSHISPFLNAPEIFWYLHLGWDTHIWINTWLQNVNFHSEVRSFG